MLRRAAAIFFGACFLFFNALMLFLAGVWLRFSAFEREILGSSDNFVLPGGRADNAFDTMDRLFYLALPYLVAVLLVVAGACLFATLRFSR
jgi:hypothetical protein